MKKEMQPEQQVSGAFRKGELWFCIAFFGLICLHGGYFYHESILFGLLGIGLCGLALWQNRKSSCMVAFIQGRERLLPFLYCLVYAIPLFWSGFMHWYGVWKMIAPLGLALGLLCWDEPLPWLRKLLRAYLYSLGVALFLYAVQLIFGKLGWQGADCLLTTVAIKGRFTGFLQYANVNALLSLLAGFYAIYAGESLGFVLIAGLSLGLSGSRTAWLIALLLWLVSVIEQVFIAYQEKTSKQQGREASRMEETIACQEGENRLESFFRFWLKREIVAGFFFMAALAAGGLALFLSSESGRFSEGLGASEWQTRLLYYKDSIAMLRHNLWGYGSYGYYMVQRRFQTGSTYFVKYVHNFFLQILLDAGLLSGVLFALLLLKTLYSLFWGKAFAATKRQARQMGVLLLALLAHAFWDFDLEFSYVFLLLWLICFYALGQRGEPVSVTDRNSHQEITSEPARQEINNGRTKVSGDYYGRVSPESARLDGVTDRNQRRNFPLRWVAIFVILSGSGLFLGMLSWQTYQGQYDLPAKLGFTDAGLGILQAANYSMEEKWQTAKKMEQAAIKNVETFAFLRDYYYNKGKWELAIAYGRQAVMLAPLWIRHRQELMRIEYAYALTNPQDLTVVAEDILSVPVVLIRLKQERATMLNVRHLPQWQMTEEMQLWYRHFQDLYRVWKEKR